MAISPQQRAQLARQNAKPSDASRIAGRTAAQDVYDGAQGSAKANDGSTVESDGRGGVYRYVPKFDHTYHQDASGHTSAPMRGNQLPGSMNKYIDQVLEMSGMNAPSNPPLPQDRPADEPDTSGVPDDGPGSVESMTGMQPSRIAGNDLQNAQDPNAALNGKDPAVAAPPPATADQGQSMWKTVAELVGLVGGGGALAKYLYGNAKQVPPMTSAGPTATSAGPTAAADAAKSPQQTAADLAMDAKTAAFNDVPGTTDAPGAGQRGFVDSKGRPIQGDTAGWPGSTADWAMQQDARTAGFNDIPGTAGTADATPAAAGPNPDLKARSNAIEEQIAETMGEKPKTAAPDVINQPAPEAQKLLNDADAPTKGRTVAQSVPPQAISDMEQAAKSGDLDGMLQVVKQYGIDLRAHPDLVNILRHVQARDLNVVDFVRPALEGVIRRAVPR